MNIRNVLVTGASGKIGRHLLPALLDAGYAVRAIEHNTPVAAERVEVVRGSIADSDFVHRAMDGIDAVLHLASTKEDPHFLDTSTRGTFNLLEAARQSRRVAQFILAGGDCSLGIYYYENPIPLADNAPLRAYPGYYAFSKVLEEVMCQQYAIQYALPITILRCSWVHAEDDLVRHMTLLPPDFGSPWRSLARTAEQRAFFEQRRNAVGCLVHPGGRAFIRHIVSIHDVVDAFVRALGNPVAIGQTFNIAAPSPFSYRALAEYIAGKLDLPVVDFEEPDAHDFTIDVNKTRAVLGCPLKHDPFTMADEAIRVWTSQQT